MDKSILENELLIDGFTKIWLMAFGFLILILFVSGVVIIQCLIELDSVDINSQGKQDKKNNSPK